MVLLDGVQQQVEQVVDQEGEGDDYGDYGECCFGVLFFDYYYQVGEIGDEQCDGDYVDDCLNW